jgi:tetratricopeptide (TPR) repeat protein
MTDEIIIKKIFYEIKNKKLDKALKSSNDAIRSGSTSLLILLMRGRILIRMGNFEKAKEQYKQLLKYYPDEFNGWLELGNIQREIGEIKQAIESYEKSINLRPDDEKGYFAMIKVLEENKDFIKAAKYLHQIFSKIENDQKTIMKFAHHLGQFRLKIGEYDRALEILRYSFEISKRIKNQIKLEDSVNLKIDYLNALMKLNSK